MANWKEKGFVPDSDSDSDTQHSVQLLRINDDHDGHDQDLPEPYRNNHGIDCQELLEYPRDLGIYDRDGVLPCLSDVQTKKTIQPNNALILARGGIQAQISPEILSELAASRDSVLAANARQPVASATSSASSPLSEAPSSLPDLSDLVRESAGVNGHGEAAAPPDIDDGRAMVFSASMDGKEPGRQVGTSTVIQKPGRNLRHRNAIQLHPYVIEKEKFNQTWRSRGLKPLHILQEEAEGAHGEKEASQISEFPDEERSSRSPLEHPLPLCSSGASATSINVVDDDFPDVEKLLQGISADVATHGNKRRKLNTLFRKPASISTLNQIPTTPGHLIDSGFHHESILDLPLSPLASGSQSPHGWHYSEQPQFRAPPQVVFPCLPTPLRSSEPETRQSRSPIRHGGNVPPTELRNRPIVHILSDATSSDEDGGGIELKHAQRRIKGVLPASWLKLDLMAKTKNTPRHSKHVLSLSHSPATRYDKRGVAQPILKSAKKHPDLLFSSQDEFLFSAQEPKLDSDSEEQNHSPLINRMGEAMEHDHIDPILTSIRRPGLKTSRHVSQQMKLPKMSGIAGHGAVQFVGSLPPGNKRTKPSSRSARIGIRPVSRPPPLSILDSAEPKSAHPTFSPAFMKIAMRTARSRLDKGKHKPYRKHLRLATREENEDVYVTMNAWREGKIAPRVVSNVEKGRQPLRPRSSNGASPPKPNLFSVPSKLSGITSVATRRVSRRPQSSRLWSHQPYLDPSTRRRSGQPRLSSESFSLPHLLQKDRHRDESTHLSSGLQTLNDLRPAILESSQPRQDQLHLRDVFTNGLYKFDESGSNQKCIRPALDRFLHDVTPIADRSETAPTIPRRSLEAQKPQHRLKQIRARKRCPRQTEKATVRSQTLDSPTDVQQMTGEGKSLLYAVPRHLNRFYGLDPFGTRYTTNFDVTPLPSGVRFHPNTHIGSKDFFKSLTLLASCNLDRPRGLLSIPRNHKVSQWGVWNEVVATEIGQLFDDVLLETRNVAGSFAEYDKPKSLDVTTLLTTIMSYLSKYLSFSDPVDRISFLQTCRWSLSSFWDANSELVSLIAGSDVAGNATKEAVIRATMLALTITAQMHQISEHTLIPLELRERVRDLVVTGAQQALTVTRSNLANFEQWLVNFRSVRHARGSMYVDDLAIETFVITHHIIRQADIRSLDLLQTILPSMSSEQMTGLKSTEQIWHRCFTLLPFLELDESGGLDVGRRFKESMGSWNVVKRLISPVLDSYIKNPFDQGANFNEYCRTLFSRCLCLINEWGWYGCEPIIGLLFDFFAKNNLGHLKSEESHGSPHFLENLSQDPSLDARPEDRCFHLLLKILGSGIKHISDLHPPKKIRDLVWRLMPNHGRSHPKEQAIHQEDLDALRNHHDLLCTLYWASPPGFRPSLNAIRTLVDLEQSHREACHINIRAWFNLIKFQLSTNESLETIAPFTQWHSDFLRHMLRQHDLARREAEDQVQAAQLAKGLSVPKRILEATIAQNQQQVEAVLDDALVCLELAVAAAKSQKAAGLLLSSALADLFDLFDGSRKLASGVVLKALNVLLAYASRSRSKLQRHPIPSPSQPTPSDENDDSQDYGDLPAFIPVDDLDEPDDMPAAPLLQFTNPLRTLLSNCFGADKTPPETLLTKLVETWVMVGGILIDDGVKSYDDYLGLYGKDAWSTLRDTDQTRKYAPYFLSTFIERDRQILRSSRYPILSCWLGSLMQCETSMKFQNKLTSSLVNAQPEDPLLHNLPFCMSLSTSRFDISAAELSQRRLSLISSVLSNMRTSSESTYSDKSAIAGQLKQEYKDLLKHMMMTMKHQYTELNQDSGAQRRYVDFVHHIVEYLQEHTPSICPVDRFFIDGATFPSSAYDPNYIVGQLKNFGLRLADSRSPKQLAVFLQSVSEKAAADHSQMNFIQQLYRAMLTSEDGLAHPHLQDFIIKAIVPTYLHIAFESSVGWILVIPYLKAIKQKFARIHIGLDGSNVHVINTTTTSIISFLSSVRTALAPVIGRSALFESSSVLKVLTSCINAIVVVLPTLDYVLRLRPSETRLLALDHMAFFKSFSTFVYAKIVPLGNAESTLSKLRRDLCPRRDMQCDEVSNFIIRELRSTLDKNWIRVGDEYFVTRGSSRRKVSIDGGRSEEERVALRLALHEFGTLLSALPALGEWREWREGSRRVQVRADDEIPII